MRALIHIPNRNIKAYIKARDIKRISAVKRYSPIIIVGKLTTGDAIAFVFVSANRSIPIQDMIPNDIEASIRYIERKLSYWQYVDLEAMSYSSVITIDNQPNVSFKICTK